MDFFFFNIVVIMLDIILYILKFFLTLKCYVIFYRKKLLKILKSTFFSIADFHVN